MDESLRSRARAARADIIAGMLRGEALLELLRLIPLLERDAWVDELLALEEPPVDTGLPRGSVPYIPSSAEEIMTMVVEAPLSPTDTLVDLGSGLGKVVVLAHLLSGARSHGIEIQPLLVASARQRSEQLHLAGVTFQIANAVDVMLEGTVFFLHAPFNGEMLERVLAQIENVARRHRIVVATVGVELHVPWLAPRTTSCVSLMLYDSR